MKKRKYYAYRKQDCDISIYSSFIQCVLKLFILGREKAANAMRHNVTLSMVKKRETSKGRILGTGQRPFGSIQLTRHPSVTPFRGHPVPQLAL